MTGAARDQQPTVVPPIGSVRLGPSRRPSYVSGPKTGCKGLTRSPATCSGRAARFVQSTRRCLAMTSRSTWSMCAATPAGERPAAVRQRRSHPCRFPEFHRALSNKRSRIFGHQLVVDRIRSDRVALVPRLYDVPTGKDLWVEETLSPQSTVLKTEDPALLAYVDPKGTATIVDLRLPKEVFQASVAEGHTRTRSTAGGCWKMPVNTFCFEQARRTAGRRGAMPFPISASCVVAVPVRRPGVCIR